MNWHLLRHCNATWHDSIGTPLGTAQALLGHSSSEITRQIYLHSIPADGRAAVEKLEGILFGPKLDPNSKFGTIPLLEASEATDVTEVIGRGDRI